VLVPIVVDMDSARTLSRPRRCSVGSWFRRAPGAALVAGAPSMAAAALVDRITLSIKGDNYLSGGFR
jgi:hypothetical protein